MLRHRPLHLPCRRSPDFPTPQAQFSPNSIHSAWPLLSSSPQNHRASTPTSRKKNPRNTARGAAETTLNHHKNVLLLPAVGSKPVLLVLVPDCLTTRPLLAPSRLQRRLSRSPIPLNRIRQWPGHSFGDCLDCAPHECRQWPAGYKREACSRTAMRVVLLRSVQRTCILSSLYINIEGSGN